MAEVGIIIDGQDGLCLDLIPGQEAIVQTVLLGPDHLQQGSRGAGVSTAEGEGIGKHPQPRTAAVPQHHDWASPAQAFQEYPNLKTQEMEHKDFTLQAVFSN